MLGTLCKLATCSPIHATPYTSRCKVVRIYLSINEGAKETSRQALLVTSDAHRPGGGMRLPCQLGLPFEHCGSLIAAEEGNAHLNKLLHLQAGDNRGAKEASRQALLVKSHSHRPGGGGRSPRDTSAARRGKGRSRR